MTLLSPTYHVQTEMIHHRRTGLDAYCSTSINQWINQNLISG